MPNWKTHPQSADGYLWIMQPRVVFAARVNMAGAGYPLAELTFDGVTTGAYTDLEMGMTLLIGTAPGLWNLGRTYVRGDAAHVVATSSTIKIGYSSRGHNFGEVDLLDDAYITVLDLFEPWMRRSQMQENGTILKDYEWAFVSNSAPIAHVGSLGGLGTLGFVDGLGYLHLNDLDASGSYGTAANAPAIALTQWDMKDGIITSGTDTDLNPDVKFPPGYRWVKLDMEDTNGEIALPRRYCVMGLEPSGVNAPKRVRRAGWKLTPEGATFQCELWERLNPAAYVPGTVVMWLTAQQYGSETVWRVSFAGYLDSFDSNALATNSDTGRVTKITALDVAGRMRQQRHPPSTMARASTPLNFNQMAGATLDRYVSWHLYNHTFVPMLTDFQWSGRMDYAFTTFATPGGDCYSVSDNLARAIGYRLTHDSRGRLRMRRDPWRQPIDERDPTHAQDIDEGDWTELKRARKPFPRQGVMRSSATLASSVDASAITSPIADINAIAPGNVEGVGIGEGQSGYRWLVSSSSEHLIRIGEDYERVNSQEDFLRATLAHGLDGGIEPADLVPVTLTASEENVGWLDDELVAERCLPASVEYVFDDEEEAITQVVTLERETRGAPGDVPPSVPAGAIDPVAGGSTPPLPPIIPVTGAIPQQVLAFAETEAKCTLFTNITLTLPTATATPLDRSTGLVDPIRRYGSNPFAYDAGVGITAEGDVYYSPHLGVSFTPWALRGAVVCGGSSTDIHAFRGSHLRSGWWMATSDNGNRAVTTDLWQTKTIITGGYYNSFAICPHDVDHLIGVRALSDGHYIYKSVDGGLTDEVLCILDTDNRAGWWFTLSIPYMRPTIYGGGFNRDDGNMVVVLASAGQFGGSLYKFIQVSTDGGLTFTSADIGAGSFSAAYWSKRPDYGISFHTHDADRVLAGAEESPAANYAQVSNDFGATRASYVHTLTDGHTAGYNGWPAVGTEDPDVGYWLGFSLSQSEPADGGLVASQDNGQTWSALRDPGWAGLGCTYAEYRLATAQ